MMWGALPQRGLLMSPGDVVPLLRSNEKGRTTTRIEGEASAEQREACGHQRWLKEEGVGFKDRTRQIKDNEEGDSG